MSNEKRKNTGYKNRNKGRSSSKGQRNERNDRNRIAEHASTDGTNLFAWYNANPALTQSVGMIPFPYRPNMDFNVSMYDGGSKLHEASGTIPGVMSINFYPSIGYSNLVTDPASLIAKEMYGKVRSAFSGTLPEDAPDLLLYVMAMDSIFMAITHLKRIYRVISTYSPYNFDIPTNLLMAITGCDSTTVDTLPSLKMQLFQYVNQLIAMTEKLHVPAIMDILNRHVWMADNVYLDDASPNAQMYVFRPLGFYKFQLDSEGKGSLGMSVMPIAATSTLNIVERWYETVRGMIEALANSEDAYTISGHLMRAYENSPKFRVEYLVLNEQFAPLYVPEVLMQIENSKAYPIAIGDLVVTQEPSTNAIISTPTVTYSNPGLTSTTEGTHNVALIDQVLSIRSDAPTVEMVIESSRLQSALINPVFGSGNIKFELHCGSEVVVNYVMFLRGSGSKTVWTESVNGYDLAGPTVKETRQLVYRYLKMESWDWHPILLLKISDGAASTATLVGDLHNVTKFQPAQMKEINRICLLSEFNAFAVGT